MAGLRKLKGSYYARVWVNGKEKTIPLKTNQIRQASIRRSAVEKYESEIKAGNEIEFPWLNDGQIGIKQLLLSEASEQYIESRKSDQLREHTIQAYALALGHLKDAIGDKPVEDIENKDIDSFKSHCMGRHTKTTIDINLRAIKTFLIWLNDNDYIDKTPKIRMLNGKSDVPIYISNKQFSLILQTVDDNPKVFDPFMKDVFRLYRDTGMRLSEVFYGAIDGNFLHISSEISKTHYSRDVYLNDEQVDQVLHLQRITHFPGEKSKLIADLSIKTHEIKFYSKQFKKASQLAGINDRKFHSLRHTFAVRKYLEHGDIYKVAKLLGHKSVTTTEIYAKFNQRKLEQDFPDLVQDTQTGNQHLETDE